MSYTYKAKIIEWLRAKWAHSDIWIVLRNKILKLFSPHWLEMEDHCILANPPHTQNRSKCQFRPFRSQAFNYRHPYYSCYKWRCSHTSSNAKHVKRELDILWTVYKLSEYRGCVGEHEMGFLFLDRMQFIIINQGGLHQYWQLNMFLGHSHKWSHSCMTIRRSGFPELVFTLPLQTITDHCEVGIFIFQVAALKILLDAFYHTSIRKT